MPVESQAQRRFMYAVEEGKVKGVAPSVGQEFVDASHGLKGLPDRVGKKKKAGPGEEGHGPTFDHK